MRAIHGVFLLSLLGLVLGGSRPAMSAGLTPATVALASSANPSTLGQALTLNATVTPSSATGQVVFYDGVNILGAASLIAGHASLTTAQLPFGHRPLHAWYRGDANDAGVASSTLSQTITTQTGAGFLLEPASYQFDNAAFAIAIGDFDGDGNTDLAASNYPAGFIGNNGVTVFLGRGDGTFQAGRNYPSTTGTYPNWVAVGDFNGDGKLDLVTADLGKQDYGGVYNSGTTVSVLLGNGDGTFQSPLTEDVGVAPWSLVVADFNDDGIADLATTNNNDGTVSILLGRGDGTFLQHFDLPIAPYPIDIAVGDFNGDRVADLAVNTGSLYILLGKGDGTFQQPLVYPIGSNGSLAIDDFDGDGKLDIAVGMYPETGSTNGSVAILLGNGNGTFRTAVSYLVASNPVAIATSDFNGDGIADVVEANEDWGISVLLGNGDGTFQPSVDYFQDSNLFPYGSINGLTAIGVGEFNHDGLADLVVAEIGDEDLRILLGKPGVPFSLVSSLNPAPWDQNITLTAKVSPAPATGTIVYFWDHNTLLGTAGSSAGSASLNISTLSPGLHRIAACYQIGDATYCSPVLVENILFPSTTTTTLSSSLNPAAPGQTVTFTATAAPAWLTGNVYFWDHNTLLGTVPLSGGAASLSTSALGLGTHTVRALFLINGVVLDSPLVVENIVGAGTTALHPAGQPVE